MHLGNEALAKEGVGPVADAGGAQSLPALCDQLIRLTVLARDLARASHYAGVLDLLELRREVLKDIDSRLAGLDEDKAGAGLGKLVRESLGRVAEVDREIRQWVVYELERTHAAMKELAIRMRVLAAYDRLNPRASGFDMEK